MLKPNEIMDATFKKGMRGYCMAEVDDFLDRVYEEYDKLYRDNAEMASEMNVLISALEEYQKKEQSISDMLVTSQRLCREMEEKARAEAESIIANANQVASEKSAQLCQQLRQRSDELLREVEKNKLLLAEVKREYIEFCREIEKQFVQQLEAMRAGLARLDLTAAEVEPEQYGENAPSEAALPEQAGEPEAESV